VRLLPFLFILYIVNYLDRTSVAYAAIGMSRELGFSDSLFGMGAGIFFVSYTALQIPGALLVERWSARRMIAATMITWGSLTAFTGLVHTPAQLYAARFALGAAEAGFSPGVIVYLSHWFVPNDRAKATGNFMAAIPISFMIGSPIAGWVLGQYWFAVEGWRWLFLLEGMPAILLGIVAFFYLTDWPREAPWLAPEQRQWMGEKLSEEMIDEAQKTGGRDKKWDRSVPAPFAVPVRMPSVDLHDDEKRQVRQGAEQADIDIRKTRLALEHGRKPESEAVNRKIIEKGHRS